MFNMKTVSIRMYTFHNCENYVKVSHDCPTKRDESSFKPLLCSKVLVISRLLKYKLCPPPFVSRVLLSWQLVDPYRYESNKTQRQNISTRTALSSSQLIHRSITNGAKLINIPLESPLFGRSDKLVRDLFETKEPVFKQEYLVAIFYRNCCTSYFNFLFRT